MEGGAVSTKKKKTKKKTKRKPKGKASPSPAKRHPATAELPDVYVWNVERDGARPTAWRRSPPPPPCERCGAKRNAHASQAVICNGVRTKGDGAIVAHLLCRVCAHTFTMPVEDDPRV